MLESVDQPSDARRLTDVLRAGSEHSAAYKQNGAVEENEGTLQLVLDGGVLRQRFLANGRVHTVAVYFQDDVINLKRYVDGADQETDFLLALEGTVIGSVPYYAVTTMRSNSLGDRTGISTLMSRELGIAQERLTSLGQRSAIEAMAHFFCETALRCARPDTELGVDRCVFNITQATLSTVLGLSTVHVNRTLQELRRRKLADVVDRQLVIYDYKRLAALADFDEGYLAPL